MLILQASSMLVVVLLCSATGVHQNEFQFECENYESMALCIASGSKHSFASGYIFWLSSY